MASEARKTCAKCRRVLRHDAFRVFFEREFMLVRRHAWCKDCERVARLLRNPYRPRPSGTPKPRPKYEARARYQLAAAVRTGRLVRGPCEVCGKRPAQGHHQDYTKPLEVVWLCRRHHSEAHRQPIPPECQAALTRPPA